MSDAAIEERRLECKERHKYIMELYSWFRGNGNPGAGKRLIALENLANGKEATASMKEITKHLEWHEKMSGRRWEIYIGFTLIIATQVITYLLQYKGG